MHQHELRSPKGATHKRKRVGRGNASGHGTYSTRGMKGQKARAGGGVRPGFEGGQLPFIRRMARKRGFTNKFRVDYEEVNVGQLAPFASGSEVGIDQLKAARLVRSGKPVKVLGAGDLAAALTIEAHAFSKTARSKIEAAGGAVRWINGPPPEAVAQDAADVPPPATTRARKSKSKPAAVGSAEASGEVEADDGAGR